MAGNILFILHFLKNLQTKLNSLLSEFMYSPLQEVPCTPTLVTRAHAVLSRDVDTPEAVVPDDFPDDTPDLTNSVPRTPVTPHLPLSPWTPSSRSLTRSRAQTTRRYTYNPSVTPRFVARSPLLKMSPKEQVVPSTPTTGAFTLPQTPTGRILLTPRSRILTPSWNSKTRTGTIQNLDQKVNNDFHPIVDASGDNHRVSKLQKTAKSPVDLNNNSIRITPRLGGKDQSEVVARGKSKREAVARYRMSPEVSQAAGDAGTSRDMLDTLL